MKVVLCFVVLSVGVAVTDMVGECFMAGFYLELGCSPVPSEDKSPCPAAFTCPDLHPDPSMCYYRGKAYKNGVRIPDPQILNPCSVSCNCVVSGPADIQCAAVDCEDDTSDENQECISTYELDSCCSTGTVCGKDEIAKLKTCKVDEKTYYQGQQFELADTGKVCTCTENWNSNNTDASCRDIHCGLELHYQSNIMQKCAPIYYAKGICPSGFLCPSNTSKIIRGLNLSKNNGECSFGSNKLVVGDVVTIDEKCMECSCKIPPYVSCSRISNCTS